MEEVTIECILSEDIYVTLKGHWRNRDVVIKLFTTESDLNNEYNVLVYLQSKSKHPEWFPKPYFIHLPGSGVFRALNRQWKVCFAIVYEYIDGTTVELQTLSVQDKKQMRTDLTEQLRELHRLGLVHGDIRLPNVIKTRDRFLLIDYGRSYSHSLYDFPPLDYMIEDDFLLTTDHDFTAMTLMTS